MKKILQSASPLLSLVALVVSVAAAPTASAADPTSLYLSPSSGTYSVGNTFNVVVRENSGSNQVVGVQANISYSTSKLSYVSYTSSGSFDIAPENPSGNTGLLKFTRGSITPRTGVQDVVTIKFKAIASTSATAVSFASGSDVTKYCPGCAVTDDYSLHPTMSGASYKIAAASSPSPSPAPPPPPSSGGTTSKTSSSGSRGSTSSSTGGTSSSRDTTAPKISNVTVSDVSADSVVISWTTSEPATSEVFYGMDSKKQLVSSDSKLVTTHRLTVGKGLLVAGTNYHYSVRSVDASGNAASSKDAIFATAASGIEASNGSLLDSAGVLAVIGGIAAATFLAILVLIMLRHMHRHRLEQAELSRHFPDKYNNNPPQSPTPPSVFTPGG